MMSAVAAVVALLTSFAGYRTANKALRLAEKQEERRQQRLEIYLSEALAIRLRDKNARALRCAVVVTNPSDSPNAIVSADLHIFIAAEDGVITEVKVPQKASVAPLAPDAVSEIKFPARVEPRGALSGQITFLVHDRLVGDRRIDRYQLVIGDVNQQNEAVDISLFRDIVDAQADA